MASVKMLDHERDWDSERPFSLAVGFRTRVQNLRLIGLPSMDGKFILVRWS